MTKRAVILHGTDGSPEMNWFPWLKAKLEAKGYEVWAPLLPENHTPNREVYGDFLFGQDWDFADNLVIGHSSGAVEVLNLLMDERMPRVRLAVMVGAWKGGNPNGFPADTTQFDGLFSPEGWDFEAMKAKADRIEFLHGGNDPYCPLGQAQYLAEQLNAQITVVPNGGHLGNKYPELPELWKLIEPSL